MSETSATPTLLLVGGPAGAGKSTLANAWCSARPRAAHIQLDDVRSLIVGGRADPQEAGPLQGEQWLLAVRACAALARAFLEGGYDVAIDDVFEPQPFAAAWQPVLVALKPRIVIVLPTLEETLRRSRARDKRVRERHTRAQHAASLAWPAEVRLDTTALDLPASLALLHAALAT